MTIWYSGSRGTKFQFQKENRENPIAEEKTTQRGQPLGNEILIEWTKRDTKYADFIRKTDEYVSSK